MADQTSPSKALRYTGWVLSVLATLFMLFSATGKLLKPAGVEENIIPLGWTMDQMTTIGIVEIICALIYIFPRTSVIGAILLSAYLGGATATHVRVGQPFFFPIIIGIIVWLGIYLREPRLWPLTPIRK